MTQSLHTAAADGNIEELLRLINAGADIEGRDDKERTPLVCAVGKGQTEAVRFLLKWGAKVDATGASGGTALFGAARQGNVAICRLLLERGANVAHQDKRGGTPLYKAVMAGSVEVALILLDAGANPNQPLNKTHTPLSWAASFGNTELVRLLIERGADVNFAPEKGNSPLLAAVMGNQVDTARVLLDAGADINATAHNFRFSPLHFATSMGHTEMVDLLLERGASTHLQIGEIKVPVTVLAHDKPAILQRIQQANGTNLHEAAKRGNITEVQTLLQGGADPNTRNDRDQTALMIAVLRGQLPAVRLLLEHGADVNSQNKSGFTALIHAVTKGHTEIVALLLQNGADVHLTTRWGQQPLTGAILGEKAEIVSLLRQAGAEPSFAELVYQNDLETVRNELDAGASVHACTEAGMTPLMFAAMKGDVALLNLFIDRGAAIDTTDRMGETALMLAVTRGHRPIVERLLALGADTNTVTQDGPLSPLFNAIICHNMEMVRLLLERGANPNAPAGRGYFPLHWTLLISSKKKDASDIVEVLLEYGADVNGEDVKLKQRPLDIAVRDAHPNTLRTLLERGAQPKPVESFGDDLLAEAVERGDLDVLRILLESSLQLDKISALRKAKFAKRTDIADLLREYGASDADEPDLDDLLAKIHQQNPDLARALHSLPDILRKNLPGGA